MADSSPHRPADKRRPFTGDEAGPLDLRTAASWTATERRLRTDKSQPKAYFFGRKIIERILAQPGCVGLRVHYATDPDTGLRHLLITGADANQNDQLPRLPDAKPGVAVAAAAEMHPEQHEAIIAEMAIPCPNQCGDTNLLNGGGA